MNKKQFNNILFYALLAAVFFTASWLNYQPASMTDISQNRHNSLSQQSVDLIKQFDQPLHITAWVNQNTLLRENIRQWIERYQRHKSDISLQWINPETSPALTRSHHIKRNGTLIIEYQNRQVRLEKVNEQHISNALYQLLQKKQHTLVFLSGHGERNPDGKANFDWQLFSEKLRQQGYKILRRNLFQQPFVDAKSEILVIASPQSTLFEQEQNLIKDFINQGGNALLITDPQKQQPLQKLLQGFKVRILPGTVVDATTQMMGISQVDFAIVSQYTQHPLTKGFKAVTLFPQAVAFDIQPDFDLKKNAWDIYPFLSTLQQSWTETGKIEGNIHFDENSQERAGPLDIALLASRNLPDGKQQRIIILGDGDFLANAWLANGGNLQLGLKIMHYLGDNDKLLKIQHSKAKDTQPDLGRSFQLIAGVGLLILLPLALLLGGVCIYRKRKRYE